MQRAPLAIAGTWDLWDSGNMVPRRQLFIISGNPPLSLIINWCLWRHQGPSVHPPLARAKDCILGSILGILVSTHLPNSVYPGCNVPTASCSTKAGECTLADTCTCAAPLVKATLTKAKGGECYACKGTSLSVHAHARELVPLPPQMQVLTAPWLVAASSAA